MHRGEQITHALNELFKDRAEIKLYPKRMIIDAEQMMGSVEAIVRSKTSDSTVYSESQMAWMVTVLDNEHQKGIWRWQIWSDSSYVTLKSSDTPLPTEIWRPAATSGTPPTRENIFELLEEQIRAYMAADLRRWGKCIHEEIILHPPWDIIIGRDMAKKAISVFFQNYSNTEITPLRLLYDETHPNLVAYQQIFKTSNIATGEVGEDIDFVFIEVADGKIRYWRTYFDTTSSAQKCEKTFRQVFSKKSFASRSMEIPVPTAARRATL